MGGSGSLRVYAGIEDSNKYGGRCRDNISLKHQTMQRWKGSRNEKFLL
jgi:hypothetical protein